jgi:hypothetical protein
MPTGKKQSSTTRFLVDRMYPGKTSPVRNITVRGNTRIVHLRNGEMFRQTKRQLVKAFHTVLRGEQFHRAVQTIKPLNNGRVAAMIGGQKMGVEKHYASKQRAIAALKRRYSQ